MTTLPRRRVGKTKLEVTTLGLGGAPMGGFRMKAAISQLAPDAFEILTAGSVVEIGKAK